MVINAVKEKDNNKKEVKVRTPAEAAATIAATAFKIDDIYGDNA